jgi:hypothetical protein
MVCMRSRSRIAVRFSASILSGIGLAGLQADWTAEAAAPRGRHRGADVTVAERPAKTPVMAIVALRQQRVTIYDEDGPILQAPVSTGQTGYETPAGIYSVLEKQVEHYSNLYDDASMPFMQRLTWSGIALHAGVLPGYPASHGCIRMPTGFAERLFQRTKLGMPVVIVRDDIAPADFTHPALFRPLPSDTAALDPGLASGTEARGPDKVAARLADASASVAPLPPAPRRSLRAIAAAKSAAAAAAAAKAEEARVAARSATIAAAGATRTIRRAEGVKARAGLQLRQAERQAEQARAVADTAGGDGTGAAAVPAHPASGRLQQAKAALAAAEAQLAQVKTEMQPKVDLALQLRQQAKEAQQASQAAQEDAKEAARRLAPVSVFISRATQRLYVRQAREPLFDAPVAIADPGRPLGTYVFTALAYAKGETDLRWTAVSMYRSGGERKAEAGRRADGHRHAGPARADLPGARQALDRITIPQEARERIAEVAAPGTSLIVSDESLSKETGKATGFIVLMSSEPQGGIRIRRRSPEAGWRYQQRPSYRGSPFGWGSSQPSWPWW